MDNFIDIAQDLLEKEKYDELKILAENEIQTNPSSVYGYEYKVKALFEGSYSGNYGNIGAEKEINRLCDFIFENFPKEFEVYWIKVNLLIDPDDENSECKINDFCDGLIAKYPDNPEVYAKKASFNPFLSLEQVAELYEKAIELSPESIYYYAELGDMYEEKNNFEMARKTYSRALEVTNDPEEIEWFKSLISDSVQAEESYKEQKLEEEKRDTELMQLRSILAHAFKLLFFAFIFIVIILLVAKLH